MSELAPSPAVAACALCQAALAPDATVNINGNDVCASCAQQVQQDLAAEQSIVARMPMAIAGGAAGALIGAGVWAAVVVLTNFEIGYLAVLVGFLCGQGVKLGAGKGRGETLQILAAGIAFLGLLVAKYFIFAHYAVAYASEKYQADVSYLSPLLLQDFPRVLATSLSPFDLLWVFLALSAAYRVPKASQVSVAS